MNSSGARFRHLLDSGLVVAPGVYDGLSARLAAASGAQALYMTGFGVAGSLLGAPDIGLVTGEEMAGRVRAIVAACAPIPLIADGDDGHGGVFNVERLTRAYEAAGAACIQLEDQAFPKRCGHMEGKILLARDEATAKIRAAIGARSSAEFLVMARTDANAVEGMDEALRRGDAFLKAGADLLFVEAPGNLEELRRIAEAFRGARLLANMVEDGKTPWPSPDELHRLGYGLVIYPISALLRAARTLQKTYADIAATGVPNDADARFSFVGYNTAVGLDDYLRKAAALAAASER